MLKVRGNPSLEPEEFRGFDGPLKEESHTVRKSYCGLQLILFLEALCLLANGVWVGYLQYYYWKLDSMKDIKKLETPWMVAGIILSGIFLVVVGYLWWRIRVRDNYNSRLEEFEQDDADYITWNEYLILREYTFVRILAKD